MRAACFGLALLAFAASAAPLGERPEVRSFIGELVERHGFSEGDLERVFSRVERLEPVLQSVTPAERPPWEEYRAQFVNERRIAGGLAFWQANRSHLERAEREYGVPASIVVAILGVETNYGRNMGRYRVIDALATLAFDYAPRATFFRSELEQYLLLAREGDFDVFALRGSYAGAIGLPQFMPRSVRHYGVDFDGDGAIDLRRSSADAIGSVANFLKSHGWEPGGPVAFRALVPAEVAPAYADGSVVPRHRLADLLIAGISLAPAPASEEGLAALISLGSEYRVGLQNFYVITRYNRSAYYASAVADLAEALAAARATAAK
ncbi:MAG: lytic murein transglycosylase B [Burkholderiales bacterium]